MFLQVRAAPQAEDCMRYCGGLLQVLSSVKLDTSLAVDPPDLAAQSASGSMQPGREAEQGSAGVAAHAAGGSSDSAAETGGVAGTPAAQAVEAGSQRAAGAAGSAAIPSAGAAGQGAKAVPSDAVHFLLQHYDRVKSTLQNNRQLGMALLEGYDQIPQQTLACTGMQRGLEPRPSSRPPCQLSLL